MCSPYTAVLNAFQKKDILTYYKIASELKLYISEKNDLTVDALLSMEVPHQVYGFANLQFL